MSRPWREGISQCLSRSARDVDLPELVRGEEPDEAAVGRPERRGCRLGPGSCRIAKESRWRIRSGPDSSARRNERDRPPVRRNRHRPSAVPGGGRSKHRRLDVGRRSRSAAVRNTATDQHCSRHSDRRSDPCGRRICRDLSSAAAAFGRASTTHFSSSMRSRAVCQRSSGSFARHLPMTAVQRGRDGRLASGYRDRSAFRMAAMTLAPSFPRTRLLPVTISYRDRAERKDVGARVRFVALELLRRHVLDRAEIVPAAGQGSPVSVADLGHAAMSRLGARFARPKSSSFAPALRQHDVAGLQIAVDDALRGAPRRARRRSRCRSAAPDRAAAGPSRGASASVSPSRYSMTRKSMPSWWPTSIQRADVRV